MDITRGTNNSDEECNPIFWFDELPEEVKGSVQKGLNEAETGQGIPHFELMKSFEKWLQK